jgi:5-methylcytosine-specific restriction enzyme A
MVKRVSISAKKRVALFQSRGGVCHICGGKINVGEAWDLDHRIPLAMGGEDTETNWEPAHIKCHRGKTTEDVGQIAKAKRREVRHLGGHVSRTPLPFGKRSPLKRKMDGTIVPREK